MTSNQLKMLFDQYGKAIRNFIYYRCGDVDIADDITQETFIRVWEKQFTFDENRIKSLLYKIASGLLVDHYRRTQTETDYLNEMSFILKAESDVGPEPDIILKKCEKALSQLTEKERVVFLMNKKDQFTYREIADRLGLSIKAIEKRMFQALKKLRSELK